MSTVTPTAGLRGRPPAASRDDVLAVALDHYLHGRRIDVRAIAGELGLGRTTIYRWFGSRDELIGEVIATAADPLIDAAHKATRDRGGRRLLETFDRFNRSLVEAPALLQFVERERDTALRILTAGAGIVQTRMVKRIAGLIEDEVRAGTYQPPVEPTTLAYAIVRLAEAFLFNDAAAGIRGDVDRLRDIEAALLGVPAATTAISAPTAKDVRQPTARAGERRGAASTPQ
jgi:AcrR family transcriptional regulator